MSRKFLNDFVDWGSKLGYVKIKTSHELILLKLGVGYVGMSTFVYVWNFPKLKA